MNSVKIVSVLVRDQDAAIDFYTKKLGFDLLEDKAFGNSGTAAPPIEKFVLNNNRGAIDRGKKRVIKHSGVVTMMQGEHPCVGQTQEVLL